jgi:hypothetical protein
VRGRRCDRLACRHRSRSALRRHGCWYAFN